MSRGLLEAWAETLRRSGDERAIVQAADGRVVSFCELDARASAWRKVHVPDEKSLQRRAVVFAAANGIDWFEIFLGLLKAGAVAVPLDAAEPPVAQRQIAASLRAASWWDGRRLEALPHSRRFRDSAVCFIKLTSGTTGKPRALAFTDAQLLADGRQVTSTMGIRRPDLNYALIPFGHSYGLGNLTMPLLAHGVPLICGSSPLPHAIATDFAEWKPTVFPGVPAMWRALAASDVALPGLRFAISAGAPLAPEVAREFAARFGRRLHSFYGSSETGGIAYDRTGHAALTGEVGQAMRGVTLTGLPGQRLRVKSPAVFTHGNRQREGTLGTWLMPDRAALNAHNAVTLLGRRGTTVKIAGRRVNLVEVADLLRRLPGVRDAWAGVSSGNDPALGAVVASDRSVAELRTLLHAKATAWKIPKKIIVLRAFPITARGKTDTRALHTLAFGQR